LFVIPECLNRGSRKVFKEKESSFLDSRFRGNGIQIVIEVAWLGGSILNGSEAKASFWKERR
jgi:hypothetical protein